MNVIFALLTMGDAAVTTEDENPVAMAMALHSNSKIEQFKNRTSKPLNK
jgi:hypothetical protein